MSAEERSLGDKAYWLVMISTVLIFAIMQFWTISGIASHSDGLAILDLRVLGYSFDDVQLFLAAMSAEGRALYMGPQNNLDKVLPALWSCAIAWSLLRYAPVSWGYWKRIPAAIVVAGGAFDYLENAAIQKILAMDATLVTEQVVQTASCWTEAKWLAMSVGIVALIVALVQRLKAK